MVKVCISCQEEVKGKAALPIKEDRVIHIIRELKKSLGIAKMNELYVCKEHMSEHMKKRKSFEKSMMLSTIIAGLIVVVAIGLQLFSGRFDLFSAVLSFVLAAFILMLPFFKYTPALESKELVVIETEMKSAAKSKDSKEEKSQNKAKKTKTSKKPKKTKTKKKTKKK